jgi:hypothetical protein
MMNARRFIMASPSVLSWFSKPSDDTTYTLWLGYSSLIYGKADCDKLAAYTAR